VTKAIRCKLRYAIFCRLFEKKALINNRIIASLLKLIFQTPCYFAQILYVEKAKNLEKYFVR
jgi:hypothetical protein